MPSTARTDRDATICSFLRLARHISRRYRHWSLDPADLIQIATVGLIQGVDSFDARSGLTPARYVALRIQWACANAVKRARREGRDREDADLTTMSSD